MSFLPNFRSNALPWRFSQLDIAGLWAKRPSVLLTSCAATLISSLLLGGGTRSGFLSDTILEFIAIPTLLLALSRLLARPLARDQRGAEWALVLCVAIALVPLIQLVPLPPWLWTRLPHRDQIAGIYSLTHQELPWLPISVVPSLTWAAVMSLLPPFAIFLSVIQLAYRERRAISLVFLGLAIASAVLGLLQVAQGPSSPLRFFAVTNLDGAVGFFANRNHLAALLNAALLFGAAWAINVGYGFGSWRERRSIETTSIIALTASFLGLVILIAAEASTRSRAGIGVLIVALFAALLLAVSDRRRAGSAAAVKLILGSVLVAAVLVVQFALYRVLNRFEDPLAGARIEFAQNTIHAAEAYMPFGSGFGSFVAVYPNFEPPQDVLDDRYVNRAHDDLLEVTLEGGATSLILMTAFAVWLFGMSAKIWRQPPTECRAIDVLLARAASVVVPLIIVHSVFDYPLRTDAMMAVFALSCAFLIAPLQFGTKEVRPRSVRETGENEKWRLARWDGVAVAEDRFALTDRSTIPVREISEEEKRRLARMKSGAATDDSGGPPDDLALGDEAGEAMFDQPELEDAQVEDDFGTLLPQAVDLDELAGATESVVAESPKSQLPDPLSGERIKAPMAPPVRAEQDAAVGSRENVPRSGLREPTRPRKEPLGETAYMLAQLNQLSTTLVERSEEAIRHAESDGDIDSEPETGSLVVGAQRRMNILKVMSPDIGLAAKEVRHDAARGHPRAIVRQSPIATGIIAQPLDPAQRRAQALQLVENFRQTTGLSESGATQSSPEPVGNAEAALEVPPNGSEPDTGGEAERPELFPTPLASPADSPTLSSRSEGVVSEDLVRAREGDAALGEAHSHSMQFDTENSPAATEEAIVLELDEILSAGAVSPTHARSDIVTATGEDADTIDGQRLLPDTAEQHDDGDESVAWPARGREENVASDAEMPDDTNPVERIMPGSAPRETHSAPDTLAAAPMPGQKTGRTKAGTSVSDEPIVKATSAKPASRTRAIQKGSKSPGGEVPAVPERARWGDDIEWPEAWRK